MLPTSACLFAWSSVLLSEKQKYPSSDLAFSCWEAGHLTEINSFHLLFSADMEEDSGMNQITKDLDLTQSPFEGFSITIIYWNEITPDMWWNAMVFVLIEFTQRDVHSVIEFGPTAQVSLVSVRWNSHRYLPCCPDRQKLDHSWHSKCQSLWDFLCIWKRICREWHIPSEQDEGKKSKVFFFFFLTLTRKQCAKDVAECKNIHVYIRC